MTASRNTTPRQFTVRRSGQGWEAVYTTIDGEQIAGPENESPVEAMGVLCFELDEQGIDFRGEG